MHEFQESREVSEAGTVKTERRKKYADSQATDTRPDVSESMSETERLKLLKKLQKEKYDRQKKVKIDLEQRIKVIDQTLEEEKREKSRLRSQRKSEKIRHLQEIHEKNEKTRAQRIEFHEKTSKELSKISSLKPLFKEIEERYSSNIEMPELEQRKQNLAKRRIFLAPMDIKELNSHQKNYEKALVSLETKRKEKLKIQSVHDDTLELSSRDLYKSKIFKILQQDEKEKAEKVLQDQIQKKNLIEKSKKYGDIVSELYRPIVSKKKLEKTSSVKKIRKSSVQTKSTKINPKSHKVSENSSKPSEFLANRIKTKSKKLRKLSADISNPKLKPVDYLLEQRQKRSSDPKNNLSQSWNLIANNPDLSPEDRANQLKSCIKSAENQTKSYEFLSNISNSLSLSQQLSNSYLNSIKLKLAYLNEINNY